ncbi:MAG: hypothetical protein M0015_09825 [Betaproteobacteria bacterium]|nr:hypothetical protein [Betaproteobacteria bacterium]
MKRLRIGLLLDDTRSNKYVYDLALWASGRSDLGITHLILHPLRGGGPGAPAGESRPRRLRHLPARIAFAAIERFERRLLARHGEYADHWRVCDLALHVGEALEIRPIVSGSGYVYRFSDEDVARVRALELDLLICCGSGILRGDILRASRLGVLSLHHGDNRVNRGGPAGFWECYYRWPQTGFVIQRLTEELDGGDVLVRGAFGTRHHYLLNQAHLYMKSLAHLKALLEKAAQRGELPRFETEPAPYSNRLFRAPTLAQCFAYGGKLAARLARRAIARAVLPSERWSVSVLRAPWGRAAFWHSTPSVPPRGHYWADPFLATRGGRTFCFVEDYVFAEGKAHIAALEVVGTRLEPSGVALREPFHLSFPFLFEHAGALYMCPEAAASRQVRVYRCTDFPLNWELAATLMEYVSAADTMLFERNGRWWMLTSLEETRYGDHCADLHLFSSDSPLCTRWVPHPQNPLRVDSVGGRNAGLVIEGEHIYRMAQSQGFDRYGLALLAYEITEITESRYVERLVATIGPGFRKGLLGTHHLSSDGRITVIDHLSRRHPYPRPRGAVSRRAARECLARVERFDPEAILPAAARRTSE